MKNSLSVVLATYNEANNLGACLDSVKELAYEIIVVDGESMDKTVEIAQIAGARVIKTTNKSMFHINKQMAIDAATGDWVLQLDADEVVDQELFNFIKTLLENEKREESAFFINRKNFFLGKFLTKGGQYPDRVVRLFRRNQAYLPLKDVHEQMQVNGKIGIASGHLLHYSTPNFSRYLTNANRYTLETAKRLYDNRVKLNLINDIYYLFLLPMIIFIKLFFRHRGYIDGFPGFVFALFSGFHHALAYMKLNDLYRNSQDIRPKL